MQKFYKIITYGCQMNVHESEKLAGILTRLDYMPTEDEALADVIVFNTCCIRENAEQHALGNLGALKYLKAKKPSLIIALDLPTIPAINLKPDSIKFIIILAYETFILLL